MTQAKNLRNLDGRGVANMVKNRSYIEAPTKPTVTIGKETAMSSESAIDTQQLKWKMISLDSY